MKRSVAAALFILATFWSAVPPAAALEDGSLVTTRVVLLKNGQPQSLGTGFFYFRPESNGNVTLFLVTNYHVVTGWTPGERKPPIGEEIAFSCHKNPEHPQDVVEYRMSLYAPNGRPLWLTSTVAPDADIAVIPLPQ